LINEYCTLAQDGKPRRGNKKSLFLPTMRRATVTVSRDLKGRQRNDTVAGLAKTALLQGAKTMPLRKVLTIEALLERNAVHSIFSSSIPAGLPS
jgi:hypothetical protein